jgi:polar amino acid transport system substrate-binding protein
MRTAGYALAPIEMRRYDQMFQVFDARLSVRLQRLATVLFVVALTILSGSSPTASAQSDDDTTLTVAIKPIDPFVSSASEVPQGFSIDLMDQLAKRLDRRVEYVMYDKVTEVLAAVEGGAADAGIAAISITAERERAVDFSAPVFDAGLQILGRNESSGTNYLQSVRSVFSGTVVKFVGFLVVLIVVGGIAMYVSDRVDDDRRYVTVWDALWQSAVNLVTVGYAGRHPKRPITKLLAVAWMLMGLYIGAQFTATLSSSLTVKTLRSEIDGPEDLDGVKVVTVADTTSVRFLECRESPRSRVRPLARRSKC